MSKSIETQFIRKSYKYSQVKRDGSVCLYAYHFKSGQLKGKLAGYEVVKLYTDKTGQEYFPGSSLWGIKGWTFLANQLKEAQAKFKKAVKEETNKSDSKKVFKGTRKNDKTKPKTAPKKAPVKKAPVKKKLAKA
ncbi:MAG: hypothetical protein EBU90_31535 [Proteobacteria bacterium]|nr:hypothetical protein [Pseudomonadota bacterium]